MTIAALRRQAPRRSRGQRGQVAIILAFVITFIILMLGLVIDSVRLDILSTQAIRAAEAGALAGALYMPNYFDASSIPPSPDGNTAVSRACAAVKQNGITNCPASMGQDGAIVSTVPGNAYELQVTVTLTANVFFLDYVIPNLSTSTVSRTSTAEYLPPIQLGSRSVYFGDEADSASGQKFWARINGPYELKENGDAYTPSQEEGPTDPINYPDASSNIYHLSRWPAQTCPTDCTNHQQWPSPQTNPDVQPAGFSVVDGTRGYNYEIVVPAGVGSVLVQIYNPAFNSYNPNNNTQDGLLSANIDPAFGGKTDQKNEYLQMHYSLYSAPLPFERSADTPLILSNGLTEFSPPSLDLRSSDESAHGCSGATPAWDPQAAMCAAIPGYVYDASATTTGLKDWYVLATITNPGTYRLAVAATGYYGEHGYSIKLTDTSGNPATGGTKIWAWGDECVYFNTTGTTSIFDLGEIPAAYAGKTLDFSLFDPGDGSGTIDMEILNPSGTAVQLPAWTRTVTGTGGTELNATGQYYNGLWLHMPITIPTTYNPAPGSDWWQVEYLTTGTPTDTITINISLNGSPVHLISEVL